MANTSSSVAIYIIETDLEDVVGATSVASY